MIIRSVPLEHFDDPNIFCVYHDFLFAVISCDMLRFCDCVLPHVLIQLIQLFPCASEPGHNSKVSCAKKGTRRLRFGHDILSPGCSAKFGEAICT